MPQRYYSVRNTDSYDDAVIHRERSCINGPARAAPSNLTGEKCAECHETEDQDNQEKNGSESEDKDMQRRDKAQLLEAGICPWCQNEYQRPDIHASSQHPEEWGEYKN